MQNCYIINYFSDVYYALQKIVFIEFQARMMRGRSEREVKQSDLLWQTFLYYFHDIALADPWAGTGESGEPGTLDGHPLHATFFFFHLTQFSGKIIPLLPIWKILDPPLHRMMHFISPDNTFFLFILVAVLSPKVTDACLTQ